MSRSYKKNPENLENKTRKTDCMRSSDGKGYKGETLEEEEQVEEKADDQ